MTLEAYKVITAQEMARVEQLSIEEGASSEAYMLSAGAKIASHVDAYIEENHLEKQVTLLIGKGNNGGDAYVAGALLLKAGFTVTAYPLFPIEDSSPLCQKYGKTFAEEGGDVSSPNEHFPQKGAILDGLLGTGFEGEIKEPLYSLIKKANESGLPILSIDIPSGVNGNSGEVNSIAIQATETLFLGLPKIGFFIGKGYNYIGKLVGVDFGLDVSYLHQMEAKANILNEKELPKIMPELSRSRHKYEAGYILAVSGSPGMPGAALLSTLASLRTGAGIIRLFHPEGMEQEFIQAPYEIIRTSYKMDDPEPILLEMPRASAMLIGPGLGKDPKMGDFLRSFVEKITVPVVIDADGLYHLKGHFNKLTEPCVLTPHKKEMLHLLGREAFDEEEKCALCQEFAEENQVTLVLKGGPTFIFHPGTHPLIIPRGDPGMATAGTGDVLTGIIAALLAQKLPPREAAALGVFIHARCGEMVAERNTSYDLIASDLLEMLPHVFHELT